MSHWRQADGAEGKIAVLETSFTLSHRFTRSVLKMSFTLRGYHSPSGLPVETSFIL